MRKTDRSPSPALSAWVLLIAASSMHCGGPLQLRLPPPAPDETRPVPAPAPQTVSIWADAVDNQFDQELKRFFDLPRQGRRLLGRPQEAFNRNAFDEVDDSSWFTNRNGRRPMSPQETARGPNTVDGPDTTGVWTVVSAKTEGVTPGFTIKDARGDRYVIKLDAYGSSEMNSGAEIIGTKLFHAAGYNVPENYLAYFYTERLVLGDKVKFTDAKGRQRPMVQADLDQIVAAIERLPDGRFRAIASKFLKGKILGPFRYRGYRADDANDIVPHQHRRELRGLGVVSAWLNHYDTKANNSLDVYVKEGYVKHYLIDFGSTLGSQGDEPMPAWVGHENQFDPGRILANILTLGLYVRPQEKARPSPYPAVGYFEAERFNPGRYQAIFPNPAFENMTAADGYWGAKLVMSFSDEQIEAVAREARYSDPAAARYMAQTIIARRDMTGRYWFGRVAPLDRFTLEGNVLRFADLAVDTGLEAGPAQYRYALYGPRREDLGKWNRIEGGPQAGIGLPAAVGSRPFHVLDLQVRRAGGAWSPTVRLFLGQEEGRWEIRKIERQS